MEVGLELRSRPGELAGHDAPLLQHWRRLLQLQLQLHFDQTAGVAKLEVDGESAAVATGLAQMSRGDATGYTTLAAADSLKPSRKRENKAPAMNYAPSRLALRMNGEGRRRSG